jgi:WD40 repeat protein/mono/diheme cytochrome c family protein
MSPATIGRWAGLVLGILVLGSQSAQAADTPAELAHKAQAVLKTHCHRCHGKNGSLEGGFNYVLDRDKLVTRKKVVPGQVEQSPLYKRLATGKMPPADVQPRPSAAEIAVVRSWIEAGAPGVAGGLSRPTVTETELLDLILADLDKQEKRSRRFTRYFSLAPLANAGAGPDELQSYRNALAKLLNSLSWHPRVTLPKPVDPAGLVLRIDLRDYQWDATLWNRLLTDYPYGILHDSALARAVMVHTATRMPLVRLDWFVATASRPPLYYDLLQIPTNSSELERQVRVDVALDIQQERVTRAGFIGSGISRNNRILERHDAQNGAFWRTYDFDAIPQNLLDRDNLLPDRRNIFAYPLGPGLTDNTFLHAGGEIIFNLPNGLHGFMLVNANNQRIDKGPTAIVSDPKRPDRAVEVGISCMSCHAGGINQKADQIRAHVAKNPKAFNRADAELIRALYLPEAKMKALMDEDTERFRKALAKTGNTVGSVEVIMTLTLRYESDVDLPTVAAEVGLKAEELLPRLQRSEVLAKNLGALKVPGATVARQAVVQAFGDLVRELRLGGAMQAGVVGQALPDNTGEIDPLEAQSSPANAAAFSPDGKLAALASADKTVRIWDVEAGRELRRCIGHTASVWCVAFSPDGTQLLSGSKDATVRLWDVETGRELRRLEGHSDLVTSVAFSPDGRRALSAGLEQEVLLWDLDKGATVKDFTFHQDASYFNGVAFIPDASRCLVCAGPTIYLADTRTGKTLCALTGHTGWVTGAVFSPDGKRVLSGADDRTVRVWDVGTGHVVKTLQGHEAGVKSVAFSGDGRRLLSGSNDATVRVWDLESGKELKVFRKHSEPLVSVTFHDGGRETLSASRDAVVLPWRIDKAIPPVITPPSKENDPPIHRPTSEQRDLRPETILPVGGTVGSMRLSPDQQFLYYLNLTENVLARVELRTNKRERLKLAEGTEVLCLSHDGKTLAAVAAVKGDKPACNLQLIEPATLKLRKSLQLPVAAYDLAVADSGLVFLSGGDGEWTDIAVVDPQKEAVIARWGGVWKRSFLQLSNDQKRLYHSSQGVTPGTIEAFVIPAKRDDNPATYKAPFPGRQPLGGEFLLSPDGKYLLCKNGTVLRLTSEKETDLAFHSALEPFVSAAIDPELNTALSLSREGTLERCSYPEFKFQASYRLGIVATQVVCAGKEGKVIIAGFDPRTVAERPRARGYGDLFVYPLKDLMGTRAAPGKP